MTQNLTFPKGFLWGASTSAHQVEGGNLNNWSEWEKQNAEFLAKSGTAHYSQWLPRWEDFQPDIVNVENYLSGIAVDHFNLYPEDFKLAKQLNLNAYRFSIEWSRIEPREGEFDYEALEHYKRMILTAKQNGLEPFVTLWHWTIPVWLAEIGGWENMEVVNYFRRFTEKVVEYLGKEVTFWITLNEPTIFLSNSYIDKRWPPARHNYLAYLRAYRNLIAGHIGAYHQIKDCNVNAQVGMSQNVVYFEAFENRLINRVVKTVADYWINHFFLDRIARHQDFIGLNQYFHNRIVHGRLNRNERKLTSDMGWDLNPESLYMAALQLKRYHKPVYITEHGLADRDDIHRWWFISESLKGLHQAISEGVDVRGYMHWSLLDNFEWDQGFWPKFGLIAVDRETQERRIRHSALNYAEVAKHNCLPA